MPGIRDRVKEFRRVKGKDLVDNEGNWRRHPALQREAMSGILNEIGIAGALLAYPSARNEGALTLIDGHLRKETDPDVEWPTLITDLDDREADLLLATYDPLSAMAEADKSKLDSLLDGVVTDELGVRELLRRMQSEANALIEEEDEEGTGKPDNPLPAMELMPFEHYDYLVLFFKTTFDFERALDFFGVKKTGWYAHGGGNYEKGRMKVGVGRALDGARAMEIINGAKPKDRDPVT